MRAPHRVVRWLLVLTLLASFGQTTRPAPDDSVVRFTSVSLFLDPHDQPLAAYQVEFLADPQRVTLVGIEGGEHPAYSNPPYYDPRALSRSRVILAGFNTGADLPSSKTRIATLHLRVTGQDEPEYSTRLHVAANSEGKPIPADVSVSQGAMR